MSPFVLEIIGYSGWALAGWLFAVNYFRDGNIFSYGCSILIIGSMLAVLLFNLYQLFKKE